MERGGWGDVTDLGGLRHFYSEVFLARFCGVVIHFGGNVFKMGATDENGQVGTYLFTSCYTKVRRHATTSINVVARGHASFTGPHCVVLVYIGSGVATTHLGI